MDWVIEMFLFIKEWWFLLAGVLGMFMAGYKGVETINDTLKDIKFELKSSNERFKTGEMDRKSLWEHIYRNDEAIDRLDVVSNRHEVEIRHLKDRK